MRISELSTRSGVAGADDQVLPARGAAPRGRAPLADSGGVRRRRTFSDCGVVRALVESGVSIAETRKVLAALDDPPSESHLLLGAAHAAVTPEFDDEIDLAEAERLVRVSAGRPGMCDQHVLTGVARALQGIERAGFEVPADVMPVYLRSIRRMADAEIAAVPTESVEAAVRYVVLGSVIVEPLLLALRRVAEQVSSAERFGEPGE